MTEEEAKIIAVRQLATFLRPPLAEAGGESEEKAAPSKRIFSMAALPEGGAEALVTQFVNRDIYDIDGRLLFRDQVLDAGDNNEIRVRTAASDMLRTPVWSVKAGPKTDFEGLRRDTITALQNQPDLNITPMLGDGVTIPPFVCYSYPKLGILCKRGAEETVIVDIGDHRVIPIESAKGQDTPESVVTAWSPFDSVNRSTIAEFRELYNRNLAALSEIPEGGEGLDTIVAENQGTSEERSTNPELELVGQQTNVFCAVASAKMILQHHGVIKTQDEIAVAMATGSSGSTNPNQVKAYRSLSGGKLLPDFDETASFEEGRQEIIQNRPFKSGVSGHARACGGYKIEASGKKFLYIYDPWPPTQGDIYYEDWTAKLHTNYIYVRPDPFS